ncbi:MAG: ADP-ribosylglycohydrolase family protein [Myxococcales bacterium]|nr:ADP-ribosylglycohydrolase family protein [Myxococcales bacterium]
MDRQNRVLGALLGVALGDALGLPFEGLSTRRVARRFQSADRFRLVGRTGFVSDDTEQTALVAEALVGSSGDDDLCVRSFRRSMIGWLVRLPFGIGGATLRSCLRMMVGFRRPGVRSAGNGAAMRAGVIGVALATEPQRRRKLGRAIAMLTHTDERAIDGALYVAELASLCATSEPGERESLVLAARGVVRDRQVLAAIDGAIGVADEPLGTAVAHLGNTGFVIHSVGICTYCFVRFGDDPMSGIEGCITAGGDTDSHAAIVGGWLGALHGASSLPMPLIRRIQDGPFGPTHLERLAVALVEGAPLPGWSWPYALLRNLALYPVVLAHGFARLVPW